MSIKYLPYTKKSPLAGGSFTKTLDEQFGEAEASY